jgi:hypothetical protein
MPEFKSQEQKIIHALQEFNPFEGHNIVKSHHIWSDEFIDVPSINSHASDQVFEAIERAHKNNVSIGITLLASKGTGKSHLISRIRHQVKSDGKACFIYLCEYGNLSSIKNQFLQGIAVSLRKPGSSGFMQWQELATALLSKAFHKTYAPKSIIAQFPKILSQNSQAVDYFTTKIIESSEIDNPYVARAIVWVLSQVHAPFAINWLAGRELSESQAKFLGLPESDIDNRDDQSFSKAIQILNLIGSYTIPIICFDELDGTESVEEDVTNAGFTRAMIVASLGKDVSNGLQRGVILTATYDTTWKEQIKNAIQSESLQDRISERQIELRPLKGDQAVAIVETWLNRFYQQQNLTPPNSLYPFKAKQLKEYGDGATVRDILQWCSKEIPTGQPIDPMKQLERTYQEINSRIEDFLDDSDYISKALSYGFEHLKGRLIENVVVGEVDCDIKCKASDKGYIQFRIIGTENNQEVKIGVSVAQHSHGKSVGAVMRRLVRYKDFDLTRGCLVRNKVIPPSYGIARQLLDELTTNLGGEWVSFGQADIKALVVLYELSKEVDKDEFEDRELKKFIDEHHPIDKNPILCDILSDPSSQVPENVVDEDLGIETFLSQLDKVFEENETPLESSLELEFAL